MGFAKTEKEWAERASRHLKAELKRAALTYDELAERMKKHGFKNETKASIANKLARGTFPTPFYLAALVAIGLEAVRLEDI
jgi:2-hydroxychromene-2-carboxylate isomerase